MTRARARGGWCSVQKARGRGTLIGGDGGRLSWINRERSVTISLRQTVQRKSRSGKRTRQNTGVGRCNDFSNENQAIINHYVLGISMYSYDCC